MNISAFADLDRTASNLPPVSMLVPTSISSASPSTRQSNRVANGWACRLPAIGLLCGQVLLLLRHPTRFCDFATHLYPIPFLLLRVRFVRLTRLSIWPRYSVGARHSLSRLQRLSLTLLLCCFNKAEPHRTLFADGGRQTCTHAHASLTLPSHTVRALHPRCAHLLPVG